MVLRGALIGCGFFAENHLNAWRDLGAAIVAVCDLDPVKAQAAAVRHDIARHYSDADEMLAVERYIAEQRRFVGQVAEAEDAAAILAFTTPPAAPPEAAPRSAASGSHSSC